MPARLRTVLTGDTGLGKGHAPWPGCRLLRPGLRKRGGHTVASAWGRAEATAPFPASPARCGTGARRHASSRLSCSSQSSGRKTGTGRSPRGQRCPGERGLARQRLLAAAACGARWRRCGLHGVLPGAFAERCVPCGYGVHERKRRVPGAVSPPHAFARASHSGGRPQAFPRAARLRDTGSRPDGRVRVFRHLLCRRELSAHSGSARTEIHSGHLPSACGPQNCAHIELTGRRTYRWEPK